jgi:predicted extracellular nuclease
MINSKFFLKVIYLLIFSISSYSVFGRCDLDYTPFKRLSGTRPESELSSVKMGSYNVLNLEYSVGKYHTNKETGVRAFRSEHITKDAGQTQAVAKVIKTENLDIVVLEEVEGARALELFNEKYLDGQYEVFVARGNDTRGIEIGFLVKKDLPFKVKLATNKNRQYQNNITSKEESIFSRDLPALHFWKNSTNGSESPDFVILGNHLKSQRDRKDDIKSRIFRTRQADEIRTIVKEYEADYPGIPVLLAGDFNANIHVESEFKSLFKDNLMTDSFDLVSPVISSGNRITHTFHPRNGATNNTQLDGILVNKAGKRLIKKARVYRYLDQNGKEVPIPKTFQQREQNPSDHFPVIVELDLNNIK